MRKSLPHHFDLITRAFHKLGVVVEHEGDTAIVRRNQSLRIEAPHTSNLLPKIEAAPWPYFSVDLLPLLIALLPQPRQLTLQAPQPQPTSQRRRRHTHISRNECQGLALHQTALNGLLTLGMGGHG